MLFFQSNITSIPHCAKKEFNAHEVTIKVNYYCCQHMGHPCTGYSLLYSRSELINDYRKLENQVVIDNIDRTYKTLSSLLTFIKIINVDWARVE